MPTVIDSLIVELGLDGTKFRAEADKTGTAITKVGRDAVQQSKALEENLRKTQDATGRRLRQTEDVGRQSSQQFRKFGVEVAALFTTLATGFGLQQFLKGMTNTNAETGRLASNLGISIKDLGIFQEAAKRTGGSAEGMGGSMQGLVSQFQQFSLTGQSAVTPFLIALKTNWADATGAMRPMSEIFDDLNKAVQGMDKPRANALLGGLGFDQGTINLLTQTRTEYVRLMAEVQKGGLVSEKDAAAAIAFQNSVTGLQQSLTTLGRDVLTPLIPQINEFVGTMTAWVNDPANKEFITSSAIDGLKGFGAGILDVVHLIEKWKEVAEILALYIGGRWLLAMTVGLGPVGIAVAAVAASFLVIKSAMEDITLDKLAPESPLWQGVPREEQLKYPDSPESRKGAGREGENPNPFHWWNPGSWLNRPAGGATEDRKAMVRDQLAGDLGISGAAASGIVSNLNAESGIAGINERNPTVPGSRGGFGWAQWTGPRRIEFESYARLHGMDPASDEANRGFLTDELRTKYPAVLAQLKRGGISAGEAAEIVARGYIIPPEKTMAGHIVGAEAISKIGTTGAKPPGFAPSKGLKDAVPATLDPSLKDWLFGPSQRDSRANSVAGDRTQTSSVETNINGPITITTGATDADGIARGLATSLKKYSYVNQATTGLL